MMTTRVCGRATVLALMFGGFAAVAAPASACENEYTIRVGDTLGAVAAKCDTTVAALTSANQVDPRNLKLGQVIVIPGSEKAGEPVVRESSRTRSAAADTAEDASGYEVRPGDTPAKIAKKLGISVDTLYAANDGLDATRLRIGQRLTVPDSEQVKAILVEDKAEREQLNEMAEKYPAPELRATKGEWRLTVDLEAEGLSPNETVRVAVSDGGEWITLGDMLADNDGRVEARARIPAELVGSKTLRWAIERPWGDHVAVEYAEGATATATSATRKAENENRNDVLTVAGKVVSGGGCDLLVTDDGESYELAGRGTGLRAGDKVVVTGSVTDGSDGCVGGYGSLHVQAVEPMPRA